MKLKLYVSNSLGSGYHESDSGLIDINNEISKESVCKMIASRDWKLEGENNMFTIYNRSKSPINKENLNTMDKLLRDGRTVGTWMYIQNQLNKNELVIFAGNNPLVMVARVISEDVGMDECICNADAITSTINSYDELTQQNEGLRKDIEGMCKENEILRTALSDAAENIHNLIHAKQFGLEPTEGEYLDPIKAILNKANNINQ